MARKRKDVHEYVDLDATRDDRDSLALREQLQRRVIGQEEAINAVVDAWRIHASGLAAPGRPLCNLLFMGPTGCGKTRLVESLAEAVYGNPNAVLKIDCGEYQHSHDVAKLVSSPPGYLGHRETPAYLSQENLNQFHTDTHKVTFLLCDEIEKASDALWKILLGIMDKATLTLGNNQRVDFSRCMIFMTSNLGVKEFEKALGSKIGFIDVSRGTEEKAEIRTRTSQDAAKKKFAPEFLNRLDKVVVFKPLNEEALRSIVDLELARVQRRIIKAEWPFAIAITDEGRDHLLREGYSEEFGARELKRVIERLVTQPIARLIGTGQVKVGDHIEIDSVDGDLKFRRRVKLDEAA